MASQVALVQLRGGDVRPRAAPGGDLPGGGQPDHRQRHVGAGPLDGHGRAQRDAGQQPPRPVQRQRMEDPRGTPVPLLRPRPIAVTDGEQDGRHAEERDEHVQHPDPRLDDVQEVAGQQGGGGKRSEGPGVRRRVAQQLPGQQEEHRHRDGADHGRRDAPAELLVAEQLDAGADHPIAERRVRPAGQLIDAAFGRADDVAARVAGVPDLVEHEANRAAEPGQAQRGGPRGHRQERDPVEARPAGPAVDLPVPPGVCCAPMLSARTTRAARGLVDRTPREK